MECEDPRDLVDLSEVHCNTEDTVVVQQIISNEGDYIGRKLTTNVRVPGNPHKSRFRDFWLSEIKPSDLVLDTIENGYRLPFAQTPPRSFERNNKSAREDSEFVRTEIF